MVSNIIWLLGNFSESSIGRNLKRFSSKSLEFIRTIIAYRKSKVSSTGCIYEANSLIFAFLNFIVLIS